MTQEEKAKAYDEALEIAKKNYETSQNLCDGSIIGVECFKNTLTSIFPELAEPEDERIRKGMLQGFKDYNEPEYEWWKGVKVKECITWLEKQGEPTEINPSEFDLRLKRLLKQFETLSKEELESSLSFYLNVIQNDGTYKNKKPKFEDGNWITNGEFVWLISNVGDFDYEVISPKGECVTDTISHVDEYFHLWSIKDASVGDVLVCGEDKRPFIFKELIDLLHPNNPVAYCGINCSDSFEVSSGNCWWTDDEVQPATKEQYNLLFSKMKEKGWSWNATTKELSQSQVTKISDKEWSEEDEDEFQIIQKIICNSDTSSTLANRLSNWLKSLKERLSL